MLEVLLTLFKLIGQNYSCDIQRSHSNQESQSIISAITLKIILEVFCQNILTEVAIFTPKPKSFDQQLIT